MDDSSVDQDLNRHAGLRLVASNRMEALIHELAQRLRQSSSWHMRHLIVVPSPALRIWIEEALTRELGCLIGAEFAMLDELPDRLALPGRRTALPIELRAHLEWSLRRQQAEGLLGLNPAADEGVHHPMSRTLAYLFAQYGVFGRELLSLWSREDRTPETWQEALWRQIAKERSDCMAALQRLELPLPELPHVQVHLVGQSSMPSPSLRWCRRLAQRCPVYVYQLSASPLWTEDVRSGRELSGLRKKWSADHLCRSAQDQLEASILEDQPLLADWGRLWRRTQVAMAEEWSSDRAVSCFHVAQGLASDEHPLPPEVEEHQGDASILERIQFDLLTLRVPREKISCSADASFHVHFCSSRLQEAEILIERIQDFLQANPSTRWDQIVIASPVIERYRPLLRGALAAKGLPIPLRWVDGGDLTPLASWAESLLSLAGKRWSLLEVGRVLLHPFLGTLHGWTAEDYSLLERFLGQLQVWWGRDGKHRLQWLQSHLGSQIPTELNPELGTWSERLSIAVGRILKDPSQTLLGASEWPRLGSFLHHLMLIEKFHSELAPSISIPTLAEQLRTLLHEMDLVAHAGQDPLLKVLDGICNNHPLQSWPLPLASALSWIRESLAIRDPAQATEGIWVGSLQSCRGIPGEAIFLIGMDDAAFPTPWNPEPFNALSPGENFPSRGDYDRLCLLESVLGARQRLEVSATAPRAGKELAGISASILQLVIYLQRAFGLEQSDLVTLHEHAGLRPCQTMTFESIEPSKSQSSSTVSIWELEEALMRPLQTFLRHQLRWRKAREMPDEPVEWSTWQVHELLERKLLHAQAESDQALEAPRGRLREWLEAHCTEVWRLHGLQDHPCTRSKAPHDGTFRATLSKHAEGLSEVSTPSDLDLKKVLFAAVEVETARGPVSIVGDLGTVTGTTLWVHGAVKGVSSLRQLVKLALWKKLCPEGSVRSWKTAEEVQAHALDPDELLQIVTAWHEFVQRTVLPVGEGQVLSTDSATEEIWAQTLEDVGLNMSWMGVGWPAEALNLADRLRGVMDRMKERTSACQKEDLHG